MAETYAIVESGGKQYRAEKGTILVVDRLKADEGAKVNLRAVMFRGDKADDVIVGGGDLEKVKVEATVTGHERGEKIRVFKYRAKKGYRKRAGHRSELTRLEINEVKLLTRKPAAPKAEPKAKKDEAGTAAAEKKPAAKKPAAKKTEEDS
jgi:large subunit ribosomal protein L21